MDSPYSPPVLYLTDDEDIIENDQNTFYSSSLKNTANEHLPRKKRKLTNTNVRINPSIINWSKRQRHSNYQQQQQSPPTQNLIPYEPETIIIDPDECIRDERESHSFLAFDWTSEPQTPPPRIYPNSLQTSSNMISPNVINEIRHPLDKPDPVSFIPMVHPNDKYIHKQQHRKTITIPLPSSPPLQLPLPRPTLPLIRPPTQSGRSGKNISIPYMHSTPPPLPIHHQLDQVFPQTFHPPSPTPRVNPSSTPEIRFRALNGTGILSAFYDSKFYRCNICKFKSVTSTTLLQHLFTHMFFCQQCSFHTYSHHGLYQHIYEKHHFHEYTDPKKFDLLYATRCSDGTFALCIDSSSLSPAEADENIVNLPEKTNKQQKKPPRQLKKKIPKPQKEEDNDVVVVLPEKSDKNPCPSPSSSSSIIKNPIKKEKQTNTYVLMKHRRCYSIRYPSCLHSLTLEYNICREHTIRHMSCTQGILKTRKVKPKSNMLRLIDEVTKCLKTIVNDVVALEENSESNATVCTLPNHILNSILSINDLNILTKSLKLNNKYDQTTKQTKLTGSEFTVRASDQHVFILSAPGINKNEQSIFASLHTSITNVDSTFTQTKLNKLPISYENTHRFLKGNLNLSPQPTSSTSKPQKKNNKTQPINPEPTSATVAKPSHRTNLISISPTVDRNNNSVTSSTSRSSSSPSIIVLD